MVLLGPPHVCVKLNVVPAPICVRVMRLPSVHCTVQANETSPLVPSGNDVDSSVHVLANALVMRHSVVGLGEIVGSNMRNAAAMPPAASA